MLTSQFLIDEKVCCGRGCRMCPYEPRHIKGNTELQKRWDMSQKLSYNIAMNKIGIPMIGLGTWLIPNDEVEQISTSALDWDINILILLKSIVMRKVLVKRLRHHQLQEIKFLLLQRMWPGMFGQEEPFQNFKGAISACDESLKLLQVDEIDLYLIHNPFAKENRLEQWEAMIELKKQGKVKNIGVSNYNVKHIQEIEMAGFEMPVANQIEIHPWHVVRTELAQYMDKHEILPIAYSSLAPIPNWREGSQWNGKPEDMKSGAIPCQNIADQYEVTVPQLFLKWAIQLGYPVLPKSVHYNRLKENLDLDHFTISRDDVKVISKIAKDNQKCLAWSGDFDPIDVD